MHKYVALPVLCCLGLFNGATAQPVDPALQLYDSLFQHINELVAERSYNEVEEFIAQQDNPPFPVRQMLEMQRYRILVKQGIRSAGIFTGCKSTLNSLRPYRDSVSLYLSARVYEITGHAYYQINDLISGLTYLDSAAQVYHALEDYASSIYNLNMIGSIYAQYSDQSNALIYFQQALDVYEKHPVDSAYLFDLLMDMGNLYSSIRLYDKATEYYESIGNDPNSAGYPNILADMLVNMGNVYQSREDTLRSLKHYHAALPLYLELNDRKALSVLYHNIGALHHTGVLENDSALYYYNKSIELKALFDDYDGLAQTQRSLAIIYQAQNNLNVAMTYAESAMENAIKGGTASIISDVHDLIAVLEAKKGNWEKAYRHRIKQLHYNDSLHLVDKQFNISKTEQLYQFQRQQKAFEQMKLDEALRQRQLAKSNLINYTLGGLLVLVLIILLLWINNVRQKQKTKNTLFAKELEITSVEALVRGQEEERQRLSHELHDKVGNHIALLKNYISEHNVNDAQLEKILQDMSSEVRFISQDLMPSVLHRFGLADAIDELCGRYRESNQATIDLNIDQNKFSPLEEDKQLNIFRLLNELLQIILYQHKANYLLIEMKWTPKGVDIHIEDNGTRARGDESIGSKPRWYLVENRIQFLKGEMTRSSHNQGNEYNIFIPK